MIGIYCIRKDDMFYVGQAVNIQKRWIRHKRLLTKGKHHNQHLQNSWKKYGPELFEFEIIEICDKDMLLNHENYWITVLNSIQEGFNLKIASATWLGKQHTDEVKEKISRSNIGKIVSPETGAKISAAKKGKKLSDAHRLQISERLKGNTYTKGHNLSQEVRDKISASNRGKKRLPESIENYKKAHADRSEEEKQRISEMNAERIRQRWQNPEQREKLRNAIKEAFRRKKESTEIP